MELKLLPADLHSFSMFRALVPNLCSHTSCALLPDLSTSIFIIPWPFNGPSYLVSTHGIFSFCFLPQPSVTSWATVPSAALGKHCIIQPNLETSCPTVFVLVPQAGATGQLMKKHFPLNPPEINHLYNWNLPYFSLASHLSTKAWPTFLYP